MSWHLHSYVPNSEQEFPVKDVIGKKVKLALFLPDGHLFVDLEGGRVLELWAIPMIAGDMKTIGVKIGIPYPGVTFDDLLAHCGPQPPQLNFLKGHAFEGFDSDVALFSGGLGIQIHSEGLHFVKQVSEDEYARTPTSRRLRFRK